MLARSKQVLRQLTEQWSVLETLTPSEYMGFRDVLGRETVFIRSGGSIPIVGDFAKHLGIPTILMGFGLPDDGLHSPNEKYKLANYYAGIKTIAHFFEKYGA